MPEYLAPGVYIEERPGKKTIEGVSTSTAGFVGMTERGPIQGLPKLVTSFGEYQRNFGGFLPRKAGAGPGGEHGHLPIALKQFFDNGGKRAFVCRVYKAHPPQGGNAVDLRELQLQHGIFARLRANAPVGMDKIGVTTLRGYDSTTVALFGGDDPTTPVGVSKGISSTRQIELSNPITTAEGEHKAANSFVRLRAATAGGPTLRAKEPGVWAERVGVQVRPTYGPPVEVGSVAGNAIAVASASAFYPGCVIELRKEATATGDLVEAAYATVASIAGNTLTIVTPTAGAPTAAGAGERLIALLSEVELIVSWGATVEAFRGAWGQVAAGAPLGFTAAQAAEFNETRTYWKKVDDSKLITMTVPAGFDPAAPLDTHPTTTNGHPEWLAPVAGLAVGTDDQLPDIPDYIGNSGADPGQRSGIAALEDEEAISITAVPGVTAPAVQDALITHCELMKYRFAVLDGPSGAETATIRGHRGNFDSKYAAIYHPWIRSSDPQTGREIEVPPSGPMVGIYARSDVDRGVHKAPANEVVRGARDVVTKVLHGVQEVLNPEGINVIRDFRENKRGIRVWGARTISSDPEWKYVNVRRLFIFLEHSIDKGTQWVVFEPNNEQLWAAVQSTIETFLESVWRTGALLGTKPDDAFYVKCDRSTMSQDDLDNGRLICEIGVAPTKPAEFVIFRIGQFTADSQG